MSSHCPSFGFMSFSLDVYFGLMRSTNLISFQGPVASASDVLLMLLESENFETTEIPAL